jgi:hypothetical protein
MQMPQTRLARPVMMLALTGMVAACSNGAATQTPAQPAPQKSSVLDLLKGGPNPNTTIKVNKYIWRAALEVLDFLPIQSIDPFTGVIVTGYGTPPGGHQAYRATIYVQDPALDARSLHVALQTRGGVAVPAATERAIEDAILSRARQLRIADANL